MYNKNLLDTMYQGISLEPEEARSHHPQALKLFKHLEALDLHYFNDYFQWKSGGEGDNGEMLLRALDCYFDRQDIIAARASKIVKKDLCDTHGFPVFTYICPFMKDIYGETVEKTGCTQCEQEDMDDI